ncbi:hypothetical protein [Amycolatopsis sp. cmx-4-68]|uniref:hypothetical protein n=1 Tax=Amycolatopsis sp. cmx-4-68 TaxID=2790938 RepID=UPI00397AC822
MTNIDTITLEVTDPAAAERFYADAFGLTSQLRFRASQAPSEGFRGYTLSLTVAQPADVDALFGAAIEAGHGLAVAKSFGSKYVEFDSGSVKLALYKRKALAKVAGVAPDGSGSHRIAVGGAAEPFTDPDGFAWETTATAALS